LPEVPAIGRHREKVQGKSGAPIASGPIGESRPGFGDAHAQLLILDLHPRHMERTAPGRMLRATASGDFLYAALHKRALRISPLPCTAMMVCTRERLHQRDMPLRSPDNKPLPKEISNCRGYFERELEILQPKSGLGAGKNCLGWVPRNPEATRNDCSRALYKFAHGAEAEVAAGSPRLFGIYHPAAKYANRPRHSRHVSAVLRRIGASWRNSRIPRHSSS